MEHVLYRIGIRINLAPIAGVAVLFVTAFSCLPAWTMAAEPVQVTVSILPQVWFVEQVGGPQVEVSVLVGPGHSPATYEPTPKQMASLEQADLFLSAGVPFEQGLVPRIKALSPGTAGVEDCIRRNRDRLASGS